MLSDLDALAHASNGGTGTDSSLDPLLALANKLSNSNSNATMADIAPHLRLEQLLSTLKADTDVESHLQLSRAFVAAAHRILALNRDDDPASVSASASVSAPASAHGYGSAHGSGSDSSNRIDRLHERVAGLQARADKLEEGIKAGLEAVDAGGQGDSRREAVRDELSTQEEVVAYELKGEMPDTTGVSVPARASALDMDEQAGYLTGEDTVEPTQSERPTDRFDIIASSEQPELRPVATSAETSMETIPAPHASFDEVLQPSSVPAQHERELESDNAVTVTPTAHEMNEEDPEDEEDPWDMT